MRGTVSGPLPPLLAEVTHKLALGKSIAPAEAEAALSDARQMLRQPMRPRQQVAALNVFGAIMPWGKVFRPVEGTDVRELVLTALNAAIAERGYCETVINEAFRHLRDTQDWMPAIATVIRVCDAVRREWFERVDRIEDAVQEAERGVKRD